MDKDDPHLESFTSTTSGDNVRFGESVGLTDENVLIGESRADAGETWAGRVNIADRPAAGNPVNLASTEINNEYDILYVENNKKLTPETNESTYNVSIDNSNIEVALDIGLVPGTDTTLADLNEVPNRVFGELTRPESSYTDPDIRQEALTRGIDTFTGIWEYGANQIWNGGEDESSIQVRDDAGNTYNLSFAFDFEPTDRSYQSAKLFGDFDHVVRFHDETGRTDVNDYYLHKNNAAKARHQFELSAHELGHNMGLYDEYFGQGSALDPDIHDIRNFDFSKLQPALMADLGKVRSRYYKSILRDVTAVGGRDFQYVSGASPYTGEPGTGFEINESGGSSQASIPAPPTLLSCYLRPALS